ncbi:MAG: hypothetical protein IKU47_07160 [Oscillospiraceae bacterium]|nr:hypothetical protein [Oscillospiraceae bacterium]
MVHLVTGYYGYEHIKSADQRAFNAAFFGDGQNVLEFGNQFAASIIDNNTVRILDGEGLMFGGHFRIETNSYEDVTITTGTAGSNRIDLICVTYKKNEADGTEQTYLEVIKGTAASSPKVPAYTTGNLLNGAIFNQMPLYKVNISGVALTSIEPMFTTIPTYKALAEQYAQQFASYIEENIKDIATKDDVDGIDWFNSGTSIPSGADLNNYKTVGKYYASNESTAKTLLNCPTTTNFALFVFSRTSNGVVSQMIIGLNGRMHMRSAENNGTWRDWVSYATKTAVDTAQATADEALSKATRDLLWENASPTSIFTEQELSVDSSGYSRVGIDYWMRTDNHIDLYCETLIGEQGVMHFTDHINTYYRYITVHTSSIAFWTGHSVKIVDGTEGTVDKSCIPLRIYGIR